jgi:hypothetical protein
MRRALGFTLAGALMFVAAAPAAHQKAVFCGDNPDVHPPAMLVPVDEAAAQPDFFTFRARLQVAVAARDVDAVMAAAAPNVRLGFGGDDGTQRLRQSLSGETAAPFWTSIARVLAHGGAFTSGTFQAPYYYARWPRGADAFECSAILGHGVNVRGGPRADAPVVATANYELVRHSVSGLSVPTDGWTGWTAVEMRNGRRGYVRNDYLGSPIGLRASFNRVNGQWRLTGLVAGD